MGRSGEMRETCQFRKETDETDGSMLTFNGEYLLYAELLLEDSSVWSSVKPNSEVAMALISLANTKFESAN